MQRLARSLVVSFFAAAAAATMPAAPALAAAPALTKASCDTFEGKTTESVAALHNLATCFYTGQGRPLNLPLARSLYKQAADRGLPQSQCGLGNMLIHGQGGPQDVEGGLLLCLQAAEAGNADAQADIGGRFLEGMVVPKDVVTARKWLSLAAEQNQANAAIELGKIYWKGDGVAKNDAAAARWWEVAYNSGRPDAAYLLGNEATVRLTSAAAKPEGADPATLAQALQWFDAAATADPDPSIRKKAATQAHNLRQFQRGLLAQR